MKILVLQALLLLTIAAAPAQLAYVERIEPQDFDRVVANSENIWLIQFFKSNDQLLLEMEKAAEAVNGVFHVGYVEIDPSHQSLPTTESVYYYGDDKTQPIQYADSENFVSLVKFILANTKQVIQARSKSAKDQKLNQQFLKKQAERAAEQADEEAKLREKSDTLILNTKAFNEQFLIAREPYVINYYVANCSVCRQLNREWEKVAYHFKGKVRVAKVNVTENQELEQTLKIEEFPQIRFYPHGLKKADGGVIFAGAKKEHSIVDWVDLNNKKQVSVELTKLSADAYKSNCKTGKGTCVIIFQESEDAQQLGKLSKLLEDYSKKPISFFYTLKGEQDQLAKQFGVQTYPNVVMTYCFRKSFWKLDHFDHKRLEDAVGEVMLGNRNNFVKYSFQQVLA